MPRPSTTITIFDNIRMIFAMIAKLWYDPRSLISVSNSKVLNRVPRHELALIAVKEIRHHRTVDQTNDLDNNSGDST